MAGAEVTSSLVVFTAGIAITAGALSFFALAVQELGRSTEEAGRDLAQELRTDVEVINDPAAMATSPVRVYVKNTGAETLNPNGTTLLVDGLLRTAATFTVINGMQGGAWRPGEVLEAKDTTLTLPSGDHTLLVVVDRGVRDALKVRV